MEGGFVRVGLEDSLLDKHLPARAIQRRAGGQGAGIDC